MTTATLPAHRGGGVHPGRAHPLRRGHHWVREQPCRAPEAVTGTVLLGALALSWAFPAATRGLAIAAQAFALLGTLVGIYGIYLTIIGIGTSTVLEIAFNIGILLTLIAGLIVAVRAGRR